jgi:SP family galactose:H+ symporter-like MFS transporter
MTTPTIPPPGAADDLPPAAEATPAVVSPPGSTGTAGPPVADAPRGRTGVWLVMVGVVIMLAGVLFGYDQGVISGALEGIRNEFDLGSGMVEVITSWVTLGALFGALVAGYLADRLGRRPAILIAAALFIVGALVESLAPGTAVLVIGRFVVGFGVGVASVAAPLYAAESAPTHLRGRFVSTYQLAITIGIFVAYLVDQALSNDGNWRVMLGISAVPALLLLLAMWPMPDSPRWLMKVGRREEAAAALQRTRPDIDVDTALDDVAAQLEADADQASWAEVFSRRLRRPLMIGVGLAVFQQITGINAIIYYADQIFAEAGFSTPADQAAATTWAIGGVNVLATLIAVIYVDRFGRRPLLLTGLVGMTVSLATVGIAFRFMDSADTSGAGTGGPTEAGIITLVALVVFIASFAFSLGPVVWTVINEIYPSRVRGRAVAVATAANWGAAFLVSQTFLSLIDRIGNSATFWLFAGFSVIAYVWIWKKVPETKGRSLEEIQEMFDDEHDAQIQASPQTT